MTWVLLKSTVLRAARYSQQQQLLDLEFRSGAIYRYSQFPPNQYGDLLAADSHGEYFNQHILNRFPAEQLRPSLRNRA